MKLRLKKTAHFSELNPDSLTLEDMLMWKEIESGKADLVNFNNYRNSVESSEDSDRKIFSAYLANRFMIIDSEKEIEAETEDLN